MTDAVRVWKPVVARPAVPLELWCVVVAASTPLLPNGSNEHVTLALAAEIVWFAPASEDGIDTVSLKPPLASVRTLPRAVPGSPSA